MFYDFVKSKLEAGKIKVKPSTRDTGVKIYSNTKGITSIAIFLLSRKEKQQIADLSKYIAMRRYEVRYSDEDL
jgi:CubicO group peptidase (beta-lactamase class C family)